MQPLARTSRCPDKQAGFCFFAGRSDELQRATGLGSVATAGDL